MSIKFKKGIVLALIAGILLTLPSCAVIDKITNKGEDAPTEATESKKSKKDKDDKGKDKGDDDKSDKPKKDDDEEEDSNETVIQFTIDKPDMIVNGTRIPLDSDGTTPIVIDGTILMPVRAFVEAIGGEVDWEQENNTAVLNYEPFNVRLTLYSTTAYVNDVAYELEQAPIAINQHTMFPIQFIAERFGLDFDYDEETGEVTVTVPDISISDLLKK